MFVDWSPDIPLKQGHQDGTWAPPAWVALMPLLSFADNSDYAQLQPPRPQKPPHLGGPPPCVGYSPKLRVQDWAEATWATPGPPPFSAAPPPGASISETQNGHARHGHMAGPEMDSKGPGPASVSGHFQRDEEMSLSASALPEGLMASAPPEPRDWTASPFLPPWLWALHMCSASSDWTWGCGLSPHFSKHK